MSVLINEKRLIIYSGSLFLYHKSFGKRQTHLSAHKSKMMLRFISNTSNFKRSPKGGPFTALGFHWLTTLWSSRSGQTPPPGTNA